MKISFRPSTLTLLLMLAPFGALAHAQPNLNNAPKADNPVNRAPRAQMTLAQRIKSLVKRQFAQLGADEATQEILFSFVQEENQARQDLTEKAQPLQQALRAAALTDTQVAALLNAYQVALEDEKTRHAKAVEELQKAVDLKKLPKVEAMLTLSGMVGDGPMLAQGGSLNRALMGGGRGLLNKRAARGGTNPQIPLPAVPKQGI